MALSSRKYCISIIFLVSPITLSLYAQSTIEQPTTSIVTDCKYTASNNQNNDIADQVISKLDTSNQLVVGLSSPKDSHAIVYDQKNQTSKCEEISSLSVSYSALAKAIIEDYRYDFSETFIDILFFEDIDLARTRII
jgi:hypothetical protein